MLSAGHYEWRLFPLRLQRPAFPESKGSAMPSGKAENSMRTSCFPALDGVDWLLCKIIFLGRLLNDPENPMSK